MIVRALPAVAAAWLLSAGSVLADPGNDPYQWLDRMSAAMSQMDYQGTFVYLQGDEVVTMRITHVADDAGVRERLVSMSGAPREFLRDSNGVRWVLGDDHSVLADPAFKRTFFPQLPIDHRDQTERCYELEFGGTERIAGQKVRGVSVLPKDHFRYGYRLWLEERSALMLKWELIDGDRRSLAKLMFTDFRMGSEVDRACSQQSAEEVSHRGVPLAGRSRGSCRLAELAAAKASAGLPADGSPPVPPVRPGHV